MNVTYAHPFHFLKTRFQASHDVALDILIRCQQQQFTDSFLRILTLVGRHVLNDFVQGLRQLLCEVGRLKVLVFHGSGPRFHRMRKVRLCAFDAAHGLGWFASRNMPGSAGQGVVCKLVQLDGQGFGVGGRGGRGGRVERMAGIVGSVSHSSPPSSYSAPPILDKKSPSGVATATVPALFFNKMKLR